MNSVIESESRRLAEQARLDLLKSAAERNKWGQFATPPALSLEIARFIGKLAGGRRRKISFLDPAVGTGSFYAALLQAVPRPHIGEAAGIELDPQFADAAREIWAGDGLDVICGDFTLQTPSPRFDWILTNPPYVRHHHLDAVAKQRLAQRAFDATGLKLSGLAGLYCYFLLIAHAWMADCAGGLADPVGIHGRELRPGDQALSDRPSDAAAHPPIPLGRRAVRRRVGLLGDRRLRKIGAQGRPSSGHVARRPPRQPRGIA